MGLDSLGSGAGCTTLAAPAGVVKGRHQHWRQMVPWVCTSGRAPQGSSRGGWLWWVCVGGDSSRGTRGSPGVFEYLVDRLVGLFRLRV